MTIQQIVDPSCIESSLLRMWEGLIKKNKIRASLFNLVVFSKLSKRTDYFRNIVQKVVEKFPCRILFISEDTDATHPYLKTAVSVVIPESGDNLGIACDQIDIGVSTSDLERVPFVLLPNLIPDMPTYLLWAEDPSKSHPLFNPLSNLAARIIFDSESADNLISFAQTLLDLKQKKGIDLADMNWVRTEGWRDLVTSVFDTIERRELLYNIYLLKIAYNCSKTEFFCHLNIQAMYLLAWFSSRLNWKFLKANSSLYVQFEGIDARMNPVQWDNLGPGTVISIELNAHDGSIFSASRILEQCHHVKIYLSSSEKCELPFHFILGKTAMGQSLVKEICTKGTSSHYLSMLEELKTLDQDKLC